MILIEASITYPQQKKPHQFKVHIEESQPGSWYPKRNEDINYPLLLIPKQNVYTFTPIQSLILLTIWGNSLAPNQQLRQRWLTRIEQKLSLGSETYIYILPSSVNSMSNLIPIFPAMVLEKPDPGPNLTIQIPRWCYWWVWRWVWRRSQWSPWRQTLWQSWLPLSKTLGDQVCGISWRAGCCLLWIPWRVEQQYQQPPFCSFPNFCQFFTLSPFPF